MFIIVESVAYFCFLITTANNVEIWPSCVLSNVGKAMRILRLIINSAGLTPVEAIGVDLYAISALNKSGCFRMCLAILTPLFASPFAWE